MKECAKQNLRTIFQDGNVQKETRCAILENWVTVYGQHLQWQNDSNFIIHTLAEKNDNVHIIDWENTAPSHPEWFYDDGIHLNADGQVAYADLLFRSISNY